MRRSTGHSRPAAARALRLPPMRRQPPATASAGKLNREREYPPEKDVTAEEPRVGVFVCRCGANIGRVVDVPGVVQFACGLKNVVHAEESTFACAADTAQKIGETIKAKGLNRVV